MTERAPDSVTTIEHGEQSGFLARWSRRKAAVQHGVEPGEPAADVEHRARENAALPDDPGARIDVRTGKRYDELTDADMPPLETLDGSSDLSVFMARNVSPALRMKALGKVFRSAKYNQVCLCAEYADDYTRFEPLGDVIPHDMKSAIAREANKLRQRLLAMDQEISPEEAEARVLSEMRSKPAITARSGAAQPDATEHPDLSLSESEQREPPPVAGDSA